VGRKMALLRGIESFSSQVGNRIVRCPFQGHNIVFKRKSKVLVEMTLFRALACVSHRRETEP
jgi:hypothetical protein